MTNIPQKSTRSETDQLKSTIFSILDAKIKFADRQLSDYTNSILKNDQIPSRASLQDSTARLSNEKVFSFIENSSLQTTKLLYLRANLNNQNYKKILHLLTQDLVSSMSLEDIKEEITEVFSDETN